MSQLFIVSAPSGAGKTSLVKALLKSDLGLNLSISHTSRVRRSKEIDGYDYHFVSEYIFRQMLAQGEFLESAEVYGNLYGTSRTWIQKTMVSGRDILLEIDCQGAKQVRQAFPESIGIFILPPSVDTLASRLKTRGEDDQAVIQKRLAAAREEVSHINDFDYVIINDQLEDAIKDLICIVRAERLRKTQQLVNYQSLIAQLK